MKQTKLKESVDSFKICSEKNAVVLFLKMYLFYTMSVTTLQQYTTVDNSIQQYTTTLPSVHTEYKKSFTKCFALLFSDGFRVIKV